MTKTYAVDVFVLAFSVVVLLFPAWYCGFPLVFHDTGGYLERWFHCDFNHNQGRAVPYGVFMGAVSALFVPGVRDYAFGLWPVVVVQCLLVAWVLKLTLRLFRLDSRLLAVFAIVLSAATSLPWFAAQLMPDILVSLMVLGLFLLLFFYAELSAFERALLSVLVIFAMSSHMSHLGLAVGLAGVCFIIKKMGKASRPVALGQVAVVVLVGVLAQPVANYLIAGHVGFTPGGQTFIFGRLVQDGFVQRFLTEHCPDPAYRLCQEQKNLPKTADEFIWWNGSPFNRIGGWEGAIPEMKAITIQSLKDHPAAHLQAVFTNTLQQLFRFRVGDGLSDTYIHAPYIIETYLPRLLPDYWASRQWQIDFRCLNIVQVPLVGLFLAGALTVLLRAGVGQLGNRDKALNDLILLGGWIAVALAGNAFICGVLSNPHDRYQSRLIWLVVFWSLLVVCCLRHKIITASAHGHNLDAR